MTNKYKCPKYKPSHVCGTCHDILWAKYQRAVEFITKQARLDLNINDIYARQAASYSGYDDAVNARLLLTELGETT